MGKKTSFFHEVSKVEGVFTSNGFVSMIRCSKHFWGTCFHPNILMSSHLLNWRKKIFLKFWHFSFFWPFLRIFSLLKIAVNSVSAILTNSLRLKNIWILSNNKKYEFLQLSTFVEFWSTFVDFCSAFSDLKLHSPIPDIFKKNVNLYW